MKVSVAALSFLALILAAALGSQALVTHDTETKQLALVVDRFDKEIVQGFHRPTDCCFSYTKRNIQCFLMQDYIETSSQCSMPAVIFLTKRGQKVCADSSDERVRKCVSSLQRDLPTRNLGIVALA
nr:C-C motif chemokine 15 [Oryctolagus cuniculus]